MAQNWKKHFYGKAVYVNNIQQYVQSFCIFVLVHRSNVI